MVNICDIVYLTVSHIVIVLISSFIFFSIKSIIGLCYADKCKHSVVVLGI